MHRKMISWMTLLMGLLSLSALVKGSSKIQALETKLSAAPTKPIPLDTSTFLRLLLDNQPRNFSTVVVFTALSEQHRCVPCKEMQREYEVMTSSWASQHEPGRLYFTFLDFVDGREIFQKLQMSSAPFMYHFRPTEGPHGDANAQPDVFDYDIQSSTAEDMAAWLSAVSKMPITIKRPFNYAKLGLYAGIAVAVVVVLRALQNVLTTFYQNRKFWMTLALAVVVLMTSGDMWNRIRQPAYNGAQDGKPVIFAPDFQSQYVLETQIVAFLYAFTGLMFVLLTTKPKMIMSSEWQRVVTFGLVSALLLGYSLLLYVFRVKMGGGYPFKLLL